MSKGWDNAMLKKLKALTGKGLSTSEIGKKLGMSKNAVVGKLNRLGWNSKAGGAPAEEAKTTEATPKKKPVTPKKTIATTKETTPKPGKEKKPTGTEKKSVAQADKTEDATTQDIKKPAPRVTSNASMNKTLAMHQRIVQHSLEMANLKPNQCRWPIGDPDSEHFHFCGEQVFVGKPYCYEHCKQAYQFTPPKKK